MPPDPSCSGNLPGCPTEFDSGAGGACPVQGTCAYPEGRCTCGLCNIGSVCNDTCGPTIDAGADATPVDWQCEAWPAVTCGCPNPRPLLGTPCATEGQQCGPFPCFCDPVNVGPGMLCTGGFWGDIPGGC
jgi:hypothetical protein